jgi:hypothetical protein
MTFAKDRTEWLERKAAEREANLAALCQPSRTLHKPTYSGGVSGEAVQKEEASQHGGYMAAVRGLGYCMNCGRACRPQFCHADQGKGMGIKTDVRRGWPGCAECHWLIGTSGSYTKDERRGIEARLAHKTREAVKAAGTWPKTLPQWETA